MTENLNILQIDIEDWYCDLDSHFWNSYEEMIKIVILLAIENFFD